MIHCLPVNILTNHPFHSQSPNDLCCSAELGILNYSSSVDGLLKVNNDHVGFYRVNHDANMWNAISQQLKTNHLVRLILKHLYTLVLVDYAWSSHNERPPLSHKCFDVDMDVLSLAESFTGRMMCKAVNCFPASTGV